MASHAINIIRAVLRRPKQILSGAYYRGSSDALQSRSLHVEGTMVGERMARLYSLRNYIDFRAGLAEQVRDTDQA
jgi:hypothetical protein